MNIIERNYILKIDQLMNSIDAITDNEYFYNKRDELTASLIDVVHAIADCYVRNKNKIVGADKELVLAFCYLNNQLKHDTKLEVFSVQLFSAVLPTRLPVLLGEKYCSFRWADFDDHGKTWAEGKREHYDMYLKNKDVKKTLVNVKRVLDNVV